MGSIIKDFDAHIHSTWKREEVIADLKEYDKNILVYLNEYIYAKEHGRHFNFIPDKVNVEHIMPASGHNIEAVSDTHLDVYKRQATRKQKLIQKRN